MAYSSSAPMEIEVVITSAKDLKNVNWRHGDLKPYAVVWVDPTAKCSTKVADYGDTSPVWDETLVLPLTSRVDDATLWIDIVHVNAANDTKPLVGSARIPLREVVDDVGIGEKSLQTLKLKRPSGRPQGKIEVKIKVRDTRYRAPDPYYAPPYGVSQKSRDYAPPESRDYAPPGYAYQSYAPPAPAQAHYPGAAPPPSGYPYSAPPPPPYQYGQAPPYGQPAYGQASYGVPTEQKKNKFGMGTGLAVGAVAGVLGGLAIAEGANYVEDKIADDVAEKVEEDLGYDDDY